MGQRITLNEKATHRENGTLFKKSRKKEGLYWLTVVQCKRGGRLIRKKREKWKGRDERTSAKRSPHSGAQ